jgi:hypothetical protein
MQDRDIQELQRIWDLKEKGAISEEEYARLKNRLLGQQDQPTSPDTNRAGEPDFAARVQPSANQPAKGPTSRQAVGIGCAIVLALIVVAGLAGSNSDQNQATSTNTELGGTNEAIPSDAYLNVGDKADTSTPSTWSYSQDEDKVRGGTTYYASTTSTNSISQSFPYDSHTTMDLTVRKSPAHGTDVILTVSSGQMMCPSYEGCSGTVRFDNGPAQRVSFNGPADNSSDTVFVVGAKQFIAKLKKAKKVTIEKTLYEAGNPQFEFDVHGLKWDH